MLLVEVWNGFKKEQKLKQYRKLAEQQMRSSGAEELLQKTVTELKTNGDDTATIDSPAPFELPPVSKNSLAKRIRWSRTEGHYGGVWYQKAREIILVAEPDDIQIWLSDGRGFLNVYDTEESRIRKKVAQICPEPLPALTLEDKFYFALSKANRIIRSQAQSGTIPS